MLNVYHVPDTVLDAWDRTMQESREKPLPLWQNILADLKSNLDFVSQALYGKLKSRSYVTNIFSSFPNEARTNAQQS